MNELTIIAHQTPGVVAFENYEEVKVALIQRMSLYNAIITSYDDSTNLRQTLSKMKADRDLVTKTQKELEKAYSQPFADVNEKLNELVAIIDETYKPLKRFLDETEKKEKEREILRFAQKKAEKLGELGQKLIESPAFFNKDWLLKKYTAKKYQDEISKIINQAGKDLETIRISGGRHVQALTAHYLSSISMESVKLFQETMQDELPKEVPINMDSKDTVLCYKVLKIIATKAQMIRLMDQMELMGIEVEEIEDGMPNNLGER